MIQKKTSLFFLLLIIIGAIWIRTYHYNEWLFFKWDQARDAILLSTAVKNGPEHLPLLGPRATKINDEYLRLGPAYYYIQYLTGVIFHSTEPPVFAYSDLFLSIASIIVFYLFLRMYFDRQIPLLATTLYAFSFLVVQYSRFSWNPNSVPFLTLLTFYSLLKFARAKKQKKKLSWFALWALTFAIASQYHFFAFFVLTGTSGLFLLYYFLTEVLNLTSPSQLKSLLNQKTVKKVIRKILSKTTLLYISIVVIIFSVLYTPVIVSELKTDGSNTKLFFQMFSSSGREDKTFSEKLLRNFREQGDNYSLITTGFRHRAGMKADPLTVGFGLFIIISGLLLAKKELSFKKDTPSQRNFLVLLFIWISVFFIITIPASYQLRPRYFTPVFSVPFIVIALWFSVLEKRVVKHYNLLIIILTLILLTTNGYVLNQWFKEQAESQKENFKTYHTLILRHRDGVTLGQLERVTTYLLETNKQSVKPIAYTSTTEYYLPFQYLLRQKTEKALPRAIKNASDLSGEDIVYVVNNGKDKPASKKLRPYLKEISYKQFGQLFVHKMKVINRDKLNQYLTNLRTKKSAEIVQPAEKVKTKRLFWRDVFN